MRRAPPDPHDDPLDNTIRTVAMRRLGVVDAAVMPLQEREYLGDTDGRWFGLFVRVEGEPARRLLARRRTKAELLTLVSTFGPERLGDWPAVPRRSDRFDDRHTDQRRPQIDPRNDATPAIARRHHGWRVAQM